MQTQVTFQIDSIIWTSQKENHFTYWNENQIEWDVVDTPPLAKVTLSGDAFIIREWLNQWWGAAPEVDYNFPHLNKEGE